MRPQAARPFTDDALVRTGHVILQQARLSTAASPTHPAFIFASMLHSHILFSCLILFRHSTGAIKAIFCGVRFMRGGEMRPTK